MPVVPMRSAGCDMPAIAALLRAAQLSYMVKSNIFSSFGPSSWFPPPSWRRSPHETAACAHMAVAEGMLKVNPCIHWSCRCANTSAGLVFCSYITLPHATCCAGMSGSGFRPCPEPWPKMETWPDR